MRKRAKHLQYRAVSELSELETLRRQMESLTANADSANDSMEHVLQLAQHIAKLEAWEEHRWRLWSRERFLHLGDTNSPYFLRRFRQKRCKKAIQSLNTEDGRILTSSVEITQEVYRHYTQVFAAPLPPAYITTPRDFLSVLSGRVSPPQLAFMDDLPTHGEFTDVLLSSAREKSPGFDGFNVDAIHAVWDFVGPTYVSAMQECWLTASFPKGFLEVANKAKPSDTFDYIAGKVRRRVAGFNWGLRFEAKVVVLRHLLQSILSYSLTLVWFRLRDLHCLERIFGIFLWGSKMDGGPKTSLAAWDRVSLPLDLGGAGIWNARAFQRALFVRLVLNSYRTEDSLWADLFWNFLPTSDQGPGKAFSDVLASSLISLQGGDRLDAISELRPWSFTAGSWEFYLREWLVRAPLSGKLTSLPFPVKALHKVFSETQALLSLPVLIARWDLNWPVPTWTKVCKRLWATGVHRRDLLFLWRVSARAFFTGSRAARMQVADGNCPYCFTELETVPHLFFLCSDKAVLWDRIFGLFPSARALLPWATDSQSFLAVILRLGRLHGGQRLFFTLLLSKTLRWIWNHRCSLVFDHSASTLQIQRPLILMVEALLVQHSRTGRRRRDILVNALVISLGVRDFLPQRFLDVVLAKVQDI
ncbi:hypothetical protein R1sor_011153 [Riccia sorocarpa]|uniref:Reverse transcriptase zinc-binding domain-containing protein n=1 Tax=Riccia sorocarpa TaxID=122646 RepID=A0ABD3I3S9_9MARC